MEAEVMCWPGELWVLQFSDGMDHARDLGWDQRLNQGLTYLALFPSPKFQKQKSIFISPINRIAIMK